MPNEYLRLLKALNIDGKPQKCTAREAANYLKVSSLNKRPKVKTIYYYVPKISDHAQLKNIDLPHDDQVIKLAPITYEPMLKGLNSALEKMNGLKIYFKKLSTQQDVFNLFYKYNDNKMPDSVLLATFYSFEQPGSDQMLGFSSAAFTPMPSAGKPLYITKIALTAKIDNPATAWIHEIGHLLGVGHMPGNLNTPNPRCTSDGSKWLTNEQQHKLFKLMQQQRCQVSWSDWREASVMSCVLPPNCPTDKIIMNKGDERVFVEFYKKMTGRMIKRSKNKIKKSRSVSPVKHVELLRGCTKPDKCITTEVDLDMSQFSPDGLRQRNVAQLEPEYETTALSPQATTIAEQPYYAELTDDAYRAFITGFSIALANQLIGFSRFNKISKARLETAIDFIITATIYSIPVALLSAGIEKSTETLIVYTKSQGSDKTWIIPYLKPVMPIILNTLHGAYLRQQLHVLITQAGCMTVSIVVNMLSALAGNVVGQLTAAVASQQIGLHFTTKEKLD